MRAPLPLHKQPENRRKKESTAHPKAKRCFPEGKEAGYYSVTSTVVSDSGIIVATSQPAFCSPRAVAHTRHYYRHNVPATFRPSTQLSPPRQKNLHKKHNFT